MLISSSFRLSKVGSIRISADDTPLDNVDSCTYLGIVINNRFSWSDHIESVRSKISKTLGVLRRMPPPKRKSYFFDSFILPIFDYGDIIWGDKGNASLMPELQVLQNTSNNYLMAIFTVIIPGLEIISANPLPIENGATGRLLILVQKSGTD